MKSEIKQVKPIFFNQQKLDEIIKYIKQSTKTNSLYISLYKQKEILTGLNELLIDFADDVENKSKEENLYTQKIYTYENFDEISKTYSSEFLKQLEKMLNEGHYVCACSPSEYVLLKNNHLSHIDITDKMYETGKVINTRFMNKIDKIKNCVNFNPQNLAVIFNGEYNGVDKNHIPLNQICGAVDFTKGEMCVNEKYAPYSSNNGECIKANEKIETKFAQVEFGLPSDFNVLKQEFSEDAEYREDVVGDILYQTQNYLTNFFDEKCINKPNSTTLNENLFKIINHTDLACQALEETIIKVNNSINKIRK